MHEVQFTPDLRLNGAVVLTRFPEGRAIASLWALGIIINALGIGAIAIGLNHQVTGVVIIFLGIFLIRSKGSPRKYLTERHLARAWSDFVKEQMRQTETTERRIRLTDDGLETTWTGGMSLLRWDSVKSVDVQNHYVLIDADDLRSVIIPLSAFDSTEARDSFADEARRLIAKAHPVLPFQ